MSTDVLARMDNVSKVFGEGPAAVHALRGVGLEISPGELIAILGPSGSGKTTLVNLLGGLEQPTSGQVMLQGRDLSSLGDRQLTEVRRDLVGFVFQFFNLIATLSARENVELLAELTGKETARVDEVLRDVGLQHRGDHFPGQLSGGEQQRVAVARALVKAPPLLLCDEPTGALDAETGRTILELLQRLSREQGQTVVMVTHNEPITAMAERVVRMRSGRIADVERHRSPVDAATLQW